MRAMVIGGLLAAAGAAGVVLGWSGAVSGQAAATCEWTNGVAVPGAQYRASASVSPGEGATEATLRLEL